jgi:uncharacterized DUF497 family protein
MSSPTFEYSIAKDKTNRRLHDISLARTAEFDFASAIFFPDDSQDYGEPREIALGFLAGKLYVLVFTPRGEEHYRVISLREATHTEEILYASH